jgi:hypothetical protein
MICESEVELGVRVYYDWGRERRECGILSWEGGGRKRLSEKLASVIDEEWLEGHWYDEGGVVWESEEGGRVVCWSPSLVCVDLRVTYWEELMLKRYERCVRESGMWREEVVYEVEEEREEVVVSVFGGERECDRGMGVGEMFMWVLWWIVLSVLLYVLVSAVF